MSGSSGTDQLIQHIAQLFSQEYRDNCRRSFVAAKSLIISNIGSGFTEQICMCINCLEDTGQNKEELNILMWRLTRIQQIDSVIRSQRPVIVLTGAIDTRKRLLMEQTAHTMTTGYFLEDTHHDLVVICCNIDRCIDWGQLMLCRCHFIMLCLGRYT